MEDYSCSERYAAIKDPALKKLYYGLFKWKIWEARLVEIIISIIPISIIILPFLVVFNNSYIREVREVKTEKKVEIHSASLSISQLNGSFILGTGFIQSELYYFFYIKSDTGLKLYKILADNIEIIQDVDNKSVAYILSTKKIRLDKIGYFWNVGGDDREFEHILSEKTEIHVPKETMVQEMKLNLSDAN